MFACESLLIEIYHKIITVILDLDTYIYIYILTKLDHTIITVILDFDQYIYIYIYVIQQLYRNSPSLLCD